MMRISAGIVWILLLVLGVSCTEYTPKPRGYFRIEPSAPSYQVLPVEDLPYTFQLSKWAEVELPPVGNPAGWINLSYPQLNVKLYCSYFPVTPATLGRAEEECRALVVRQAKYPDLIREQAYTNPEASVYGSLFMLDGESASPLQFMLTDSVSRFFRGALYYDCIPNADSLAPVTDYLKQDVIELIQSFNWKK